MSEYIVIKDKGTYHIIKEEDVSRTEVFPHNIRIHRETYLEVIVGQLIGVFEKYSEAVRSTIEQD